jgi:hypothetical protein
MPAKVEQWLPVIGSEGLYEVSDLGRVRSTGAALTRGVVLQQFTDKDGYLRVGLSSPRKQVAVHRLVLEAFRGPCPEGHQGCHNNGVKSDCRLGNLRWDTLTANIADRFEHGTANHKLSAEKVRKLRAQHQSGASITALSKQFGISMGLTSMVAARKRWAHV